MKKSKTLLMLGAVALFISSCGSCNRVEPNKEGVLMSNYGRNGKEDFKAVTGSQGFILGPGTELYQVPMWEQKADVQKVSVTAKDAGYFSIDPMYTYQPIRGKGVDIVFAYKYVGLDDSSFMDKIEGGILNNLVVNAYREEARNYSTDSLMTNVNAFEKRVEQRLTKEFARKYFAINSLTSGVKPPESMSAAIEARNNAIQESEKAKNDLKTAKYQQEKAIIDAETNRIRTAGLSEKNLTEKWIEAIRTTQNRVIITDGKTPVFLTP